MAIMLLLVMFCLTYDLLSLRINLRIFKYVFSNIIKKTYITIITPPHQPTSGTKGRKVFLLILLQQVTTGTYLFRRKILIDFKLLLVEAAWPILGVWGMETKNVRWFEI